MEKVNEVLKETNEEIHLIINQKRNYPKTVKFYDRISF